jgi:CheY-like chemotaxis protein
VPKVIFGDDVRIRQVIVNIINNAVKYTREGSVEFRVTKRRENEKDLLVFGVKDTGIGIREEDFQKIFDRFRQTDNMANRGITGTGLGLSITRRLVDLMKGDIRLKSEYGKGSEFTVLLPLVPGDPSLVEEDDISSFVAAKDGVAALVVDDNTINLKVSAAYLAKHKIGADTALSGREGIEKIKGKNYDLVFMDHSMPEMDGVETVKRIRALDGERFKQTPIIALTANAVSGAREFFLEAGMNDFISKPIDPRTLNRKLMKWLPAGKFSLEKKDESGSSGDKAPPRAGGTPAEGAEGKAFTEEAIDRKAGLRNAVGDPELYAHLLKVFVEDHGGDAEKIKGALAGGDGEQARRIAHTLKSAAALIGAEKLRRAAAVLEKLFNEQQAAGGAEKAAGADADIAALEDSFYVVLAELNRAAVL